MRTLLQVVNLSKSYGSKVLFHEANLVVAEKQKIGFMGRNGAGKSTLLKMIIGQEEADKGKIVLHDAARLGYLEQHGQWHPDETVMDFLKRTSGLEDWRCAATAGKFQLKNEILNTPITALSGGFQMRAKLVSMLLKDPNFFLLDEPTNYLDVHTLLLLERFLRSYRGAFIIISHDREFLKNTCEQTLEAENGNLVLYPQPLEQYLAFKQEQREMKERYNKKVEREKQHLQTFVDRFRYKASKATQAQSKLKQIAKLKKIEILNPASTTRIRIPMVEEKKGPALRTNDLVIGYPENKLVSDIKIEIERGEHVALLGDNGQGKTTFLKTIAGFTPSLGGSFRWGHNITCGYYDQMAPNLLDPQDTVLRYLTRLAGPNISEEDILAMAGDFLFREDDLKKQIAVLSGGEKARLYLAGLLLSRNPVLLLDEATNHLDFETVEAFGEALNNFNGTVIFITHNRTFVNLAADGIIEIKNNTMRRFPGTYEEYIEYLREEDAEKKLDSNEDEAPVNVVDEKKLRKLEERRLTKELQRIESNMENLKKEKDKLLKYFEKNPSKYSPEKNSRYKDIVAELETEEKKWLEIQMVN